MSDIRISSPETAPSLLTPQPQARRALCFSILCFAWCFAIWCLYAALGLELAARLQLSATDYGLLLSSPVLTGALLRFPAGILAEKISPRTLWFWLMLLLVPALLLLPYAQSLLTLVLLGLWLGLAGVAFTLGIAYVSAFYPPAQQGTIMGLFGVGNAGAALSLLLVPLLNQLSLPLGVGALYALLTALLAVLFVLFAPAMPQSAHITAVRAQPNKHSPFWQRSKQLFTDARLWRFSLYYYFVFGSFLALLLWLPLYYMQAYQLSAADAMAFTLFFVTTSSMVRALGGWLADRYGGRAVNWSVFWICLICLFILSYPPTSLVIHGIKKEVVLEININLWLFTALIFVIGIAQGLGRASVFRTIYDYYPNQLGAAGGMVAAIGALGGCTLPLLFGLSQDLLGIHTACFMLLYGVLAFCMILMFFANQREQYQRELAAARAHNFLLEDGSD
ncbi:MFS transporter [Rheinheimera sp. 4Y26]|uniref:MFS transporter n=1 Tax=Rheinheimera sp. 4Y26 TaxID=2977811 RepID=UPI0021B113BC|nr:MFS transporter [Rheinheimera sp. 4Y26]MCT6701199.1 MFS transporter [Rheinheimera sp. 4Y26]